MGAGFNHDTAAGVVGAVVLIAAMGGVFFYERSQFETYEVSWQTAEAVTADESDEELDAGGSESYTFTAEDERISTTTTSVSWTDDVGDPDTFRLTVEGPNGTYTDTGEASSSPLEVEVPIHEEPGTATAAGRSLEDARDQVNASASWTNGTGEWTVTVELVDAPGQQVGGQDAGNDGSQDYDVTFTYNRWVWTLEPSS